MTTPEKPPENRPTPAKAEPAATPAAAAKPAAAPAAAPKLMASPDTGPIRQAELGKKRGLGLGAFGSFLAFVGVPVTAVAVYLWSFAADQYASNVGFSVRSTETQTAFEFLGSMTSLGGASNYDSQVLFDYLQSQLIVASIDETLDVRQLWSKPVQDPVFAWSGERTSIEALTQYWQRMVTVEYDENNGLIRIQVRAFTPDDAQAIAQEILSESVVLVNQLAATAQQDAIRFSEEELRRAEDRLKEARRAISTFRNRFQIVDPTLDLQAQMEIFAALEQQKTDALIELDLLRGTTRENDPRITQTERRLAVIEDRLTEERRQIGGGVAAMDEGSVAMSEVLGQYEALSVEREFAEGAYVAALASYDRSRAEAERQSLYLATHIPPTLSETAEYPKRAEILAIFGCLLFSLWMVLRVMAAALRQRQ